MAEKISLSNDMLAHTASAASWLSTHVRPVGTLMVGGDKRVRPIWYRPTDLSSGDPGEAWAKFPGDPKGTELPIPRMYRQVARVDINSQFASDLRKTSSSSPESRLNVAIAWHLGSRIMAGVLRPEDRDQILDQGYYGMRVGRGELVTTLGLPLSGERKIVIHSNSVEASGVPVDLGEFPEDGLIF